MKTLGFMEKAIINALVAYMEKHGLHQNELAKLLGWSPSDLNDILKGRKGVGKHRQAFLEDKLGEYFKRDFMIKINELSESGKRQKKQGNPAVKPMVANCKLTNTEHKYVERLLAILRGPNKHAKLAAQMNINALYPHTQEKQDITDKEIRVMLGRSGA